MLPTSVSDAKVAVPRPRRWARRLGCLLPIGLLVVLLVNEWLVRPMLNPLRQSPAAIERELLERIPPGTPRAEVETWADVQGLGHGGRPYPLGTEWPVQRALGRYSSFGFTVVVFAEWTFGPDGRLVAVEVHKWVADAP
jgi:hypothetical protein